jgi:hypothetical protein
MVMGRDDEQMEHVHVVVVVVVVVFVGPGTASRWHHVSLI